MKANSEDVYYHASLQIVSKPQWDYWPVSKDKERRDFGKGFYLCKNNREYPIRLYSKYYDSIVLNKYRFNHDNIKVLKLPDDIRWLLVVACHRSDLSKYRKYHLMRDLIRQAVSSYDLVVGTISNDRFFSTAALFIKELATDTLTIEIAQMMDFGTQYVSKSHNADRFLKYIGHEIISPDEIIPIRKQVLRDEEMMEELVDDKRGELIRRGMPGSLLSDHLKKMGGMSYVDIAGWLQCGQGLDG